MIVMIECRNLCDDDQPATSSIAHPAAYIPALTAVRTYRSSIINRPINDGRRAVRGCLAQLVLLYGGMRPGRPYLPPAS